MSSHYYTPDGRLINGLREARKVPGALPSPSTVLTMIKGEGLIHYFKRSMFVATMTTPRREGSTDEEHYADCCKWADEHSGTARDFGTDIHAKIREFNRSVATERGQVTHRQTHRNFEKSIEADERLERYADWFLNNIAQVFHVEQFVAGVGYGGTEDLRAKLIDGRIASIDFKTQGIAKKGKFNHYIQWALQLGAYGKADAPMPELIRMAKKADGEITPRADVIISVCIGSDLPIVEAYEWPKPAAEYHRLFLAMLEIWREETGF